jgi:ABC-type phosphate transport system auxiliary subunit
MELTIPLPADFSKATLVWVDRNGRSEPLTSEQRDYWQPALSPDGERLAVRIGKTALVRSSTTPGSRPVG